LPLQLIHRSITFAPNTGGDLVKIFLVFLVLSISTTATATNPWLGQQKAIVLLLEWSDKAKVTSQQDVDSTFFDESNLSLRQYFAENSQGKFDLNGSVLDWKRADLAWNVDQGCNPTFIAKEAWKLFSSDINIADYDSNLDGKIDHLFVVHSGRIPHDRVGPSCMFGSLAQAEHTIVFQSEGVGYIGSAIPIGFYVHEAGHDYYNFPDLYDDHYHGKYGIAMWGAMGLGAWGVTNTLDRNDLFRYPSHFEPMSKIKMGWATPLVVKQSQTSLKLRPVETSGDIIVIPRGDGSNLYLEYRSKYGFSENHRGHGLLIWKDYDIIQADGRDDINNGTSLGYRPLPPILENFGDESDPFPGSLNITQYVDEDAGVRIENIVQTEDSIVLDVVVTNSHLELNLLNSKKIIAPKRLYSNTEHL